MTNASVDIFDGNQRFYCSEYDRDDMETAVQKGIEKAKRLTTESRTMFVRDCLGGLRAEVSKRDGKISVKRN